MAGAKCENPQCNIETDGRCVEGIDPVQECPHFGREPVLEAVEDVDENEEEEVSDTPRDNIASVELPDAGLLDRDGASLVRGRRPSRVVAIIGGAGSGKTSMVAGLFDLFQVGPVAGMQFAGSSTLVGFEMACHDARAASGRSEPHSARTPRGDAEFFHIDLRCAAEVGLVSLFIGNRAGEEYEEIASDVSLAAGLFEIGFANTLTMLVDGDRLASSRDRHNAIAEPALILQGLLDGDVLPGGQQLAMVLTKLDAVRRSPQQTRALADFDKIVARITRVFSEPFSSIRGFATAASPNGPEAVRGEGLSPLLAYWTNESVVAPVAHSTYGGQRAFAQLRGQDE